MKQNLRIAVLFTLVTTVIFGLIYPLAVTGLAQLLFPAQANGSLITKNGQIVGSRLLGQTFSSPGYFRLIRLSNVFCDQRDRSVAPTSAIVSPGRA